MRPSSASKGLPYQSLILLKQIKADEALSSGEDEAPRAYIVPKSVGSVTAKDIHDFINSRVSSIKRLSGGVIFTDVIPKNPVSLVIFFVPGFQAFVWGGVWR